MKNWTILTYFSKKLSENGILLIVQTWLTLQKLFFIRRQIENSIKQIQFNTIRKTRGSEGRGTVNSKPPCWLDICPHFPLFSPVATDIISVNPPLKQIQLNTIRETRVSEGRGTANSKHRADWSYVLIFLFSPVATDIIINQPPLKQIQFNTIRKTRVSEGRGTVNSKPPCWLVICPHFPLFSPVATDIIIGQPLTKMLNRNICDWRRKTRPRTKKLQQNFQLYLSTVSWRCFRRADVT
jgi:hypothetical protein